MNKDRRWRQRCAIPLTGQYFWRPISCNGRAIVGDWNCHLDPIFLTIGWIRTHHCTDNCGCILYYNRGCRTIGETVQSVTTNTKTQDQGRNTDGHDGGDNNQTTTAILCIGLISITMLVGSTIPKADEPGEISAVKNAYSRVARSWILITQTRTRRR